MNLTRAELTQVPLPAAVLDPHDTVIACTAEWTGATPGAVSYPVRRNRLIVCTGNIDPQCTELLEQLLDAMDSVAREVPRPHAVEIGMLASSLRLLAGRRVVFEGTSRDVLEQASIGIAARTSLRLRLEPGPETTVVAPDVVALILVQLAANAERHAGASMVTLAQRDGAFDVQWRQTGNVSVNLLGLRQRAARERWGLGFARIAADTLGGVVYPPRPSGDGSVLSRLELGLVRLSLPLAAVRDGQVLKATRAWGEETGREPGAVVETDARLADAVATARRAGGRLSIIDGWWARASGGGSVVWLAVPPDDILDRARDVLAGILHEQALWAHVPEPSLSHIFALATLLDRALGTPLPRVPSSAWMHRYGQLLIASPTAAQLPVPELLGPGAIDPRVVFHVVAAGGERFEVQGDDLYLHVREGSLRPAVALAFERRADGALKLS